MLHTKPHGGRWLDEALELASDHVRRTRRLGWAKSRDCDPGVSSGIDGTSPFWMRGSDRGRVMQTAVGRAILAPVLVPDCPPQRAVIVTAAVAVAVTAEVTAAVTAEAAVTGQGHSHPKVRRDVPSPPTCSIDGQERPATASAAARPGVSGRRGVTQIPVSTDACQRSARR